MTRHLRGGRALAALAVAAVAGLLTISGAANAAPDSKGTDYWLMFNQNLAPPTLSLFITSDVTTSGTVEIPGLTTPLSTPFTVTAGMVTTVPIPVTAQVLTSDLVESKGIHVTALDEVTVYGLNQAEFTTDAYLGLPTDVLGTEYIVLGYRSPTFFGGSQFGITATQDNTAVTITPSVDTAVLPPVLTRPAGVPYTITMNAGQTYQLRNGAGTADLSGTTITSDKPVAVFGGHLCANVPPEFQACDHLVEQLPPPDAWGESFVTMPLATRLNGDTFRFLAAEDDTTVSVNGTAVATLDSGQVHEQLVTGAAVITASGPILVAQYSNGTLFDNVTSDPFMMLIPPSEQFLADYTITTPAAGFATNFVNVVAPTAAVGSITLDGTAVPAASFTPIGASGFSGAQLAVSVGSHRLQGALPFGVHSYGFAPADSYGYPGGASFSPVAVVSNLNLTPESDTNVVGQQHCVTATVTDQGGAPLGGIRVDFSVTGDNTASGFAFTGSNGGAEFCYTGTNTGSDTITAAVGSLTDTATKLWTPEPPVATTLSLTPESDTNFVGAEHCVTAEVDDQRGDPFVGGVVSFAVTGTHTASGSDTTDAGGLAEFCYTGTTVGGDTITATLGQATDAATKTWQLEPPRATTLSLTPESDTNFVGAEHCVTAEVDDQRGDPFVGGVVSFAVTGTHTASGSDTTDAGGLAEFCYTGTTVGGDTITATLGQATDTATKSWIAVPSEDRTVLLVLDEDGLGKGLTTSTPGTKLTVKTGQAGDEGWFAPTCIPRKWLGGSNGNGNECLTGADRETAIENYVGANGAGAVPKGSRLDKVPAVMPLRALGLASLQGENVCAVVYDSDVSVNYNTESFPFTDANLQGKSRVVAFHVETVTTERGSTKVTLELLAPSACADWVLFNAPVPRSSSVPDDRRAGSPDTGKNGYRQLRTFPDEELFF